LGATSSTDSNDISENVRTRSHAAVISNSKQAKFGAAIGRYEQYQAQKELWNEEHAQLKSEVKYKAEAVCLDLLG